MDNLVKENVDRALRNFYNIPSWNVNMTSKEVNYMYANYSDIVICNGRVRKIKVENITENNFNVYTV